MSAVKSIICLEAEMEIQRPQMPLNISGGLLMICCSNSKHEISSVSLKDFDMFHLFIIYLLLLFFCSTEHCIFTLIFSLSDKTTVDYDNDVYCFCLMTKSIGFPWRSSFSVLSLLEELSMPVRLFHLQHLF